MLFLEDEQWNTEDDCFDPHVLAHIREVVVEGRSRTPWLSIQRKMPARIEYCVRTVENYQSGCLGARIDLSDGSEGRTILNMIFDKVLSFDDVPFTWRRFCELLYDPLRNYSDTMKYIRALYKVINVEMTVRETQTLLRLQPEPVHSFTPVTIFFDESNLKTEDRKKLREDVEKAKNRLKMYIEENKENDTPQSDGA